MNAWGLLGKPTPEKVQEWMDLPYGKFKEMVSDVKKQTKGKPLRKFMVEIQDISTSYKSASVKVEAATTEHAIKIAQTVDRSTLDWSEPKQEEYNKYSYRVTQVWD